MALEFWEDHVDQEEKAAANGIQIVTEEIGENENAFDPKRDYLTLQHYGNY